MCFRYVGVDLRTERLRERLEELRDRYRDVPMAGDPTVGDRYPGDVGEFIVQGGEILSGRWGLQPAWASDPNFGKRNAYNARSETVAEKPTFRAAFRSRRCVVPIASFYERADGRWLRVDPRKGESFLVAGLFELGEPLSFTLVTTEPNSAMAQSHDRMPVILAPADAEIWNDRKTKREDLKSLMLPCPSEWTEVFDAGPIIRKQKVLAPKLFDDF